MDMSEFRAAVGRLMEDDMAQHSDQLDRIERDLKIIKAALGAQRPIRRKLVRLNQRLKAALAKKENAA